MNTQEACGYPDSRARPLEIGAPYYWQMSLGPGQRVLVKGGMLYGNIEGDAAEWIPATARIVP